MSDYIPHELLNEILTRLPAKSLLRFTAVCKSWYYLITNPSFINSHFNQIASNTQTLLIRHYDKDEKKEHYNLRRDDETFNEHFLEIDFPFKRPVGFPFKSPVGYSRIIGCCSGLICLTDDLFADMESAVVWNPSIRKSVTIQIPNKPQWPHMIVLGFGVCPVSNEPKVVKIVYYKDYLYDYKGPPDVEIYSLRTGQWKSLSSIPPRYYMVEFLWSQAFMNGAIHWIAYDKRVEGSSQNLIVSFDVSNEIFSEIMLPDSLTRELPVTSLSIGKFGESLVVVKYNVEAEVSSCCIWAMKEYGVFESWTKLFTITLPGLLKRTVGFRTNGEVVLGFRNSELVSYDPNTQQIRDFGIVGNIRSFYVDNYMETLFLLRRNDTLAEDDGVNA